jgi:hypothetical protein
LATTTTDGPTAIRSALRELEDAGYATLRKVQIEGGLFGGSEWVISEVTESEVLRDSENPSLGKPVSNESIKTMKTDKSKKRPARTAPISKQDALNYAAEIGLSIEDVESFFDHHQARDWIVRGTRIVDGRAALRTWLRLKPRYERKTGIERAPINVRNKRINDLNKRKQDLIRANAPYWQIHEIDMQLSKL